jgi:hypothetical protein
VKLTSLMLLAVGFALTACSPQPAQYSTGPMQPQPVRYASVAQCVSDGNNPDLCAQAARSLGNPYGGMSSCEAVYGPSGCYYNNNGYYPLASFAAGFMLGSASQPATVIYHTRSGAYYSGSRVIASPPPIYSGRVNSAPYVRSASASPRYVGTTASPYVRNPSTGYARNPAGSSSYVRNSATPVQTTSRAYTAASSYRSSASSSYRSSASSSYGSSSSYGGTSSSYRSSSSLGSSSRRR